MNIYSTQKCGDVIVKEWRNDYAIVVVFVNTGYETATHKWSLEKGAVSDPYAPLICGKGYLGEGPYPITVGGKRTPMYAAWIKMIETQTVCDEWLNYQNFAEWYATNHRKGLRLRCGGSPDNSKFVALVTYNDPYAPTVYGKGYLGEGPYKSVICGKMTNEYACWRNLLAKRNVCDEWLNFQNFAAWYMENHKEGHRLKCNGETYSPETTTFYKKKTYKGCYWKESIGKWRGLRYARRS